MAVRGCCFAVEHSMICVHVAYMICNIGGDKVIAILATFEVVVTKQKLLHWCLH